MVNRGRVSRALRRISLLKTQLPGSGAKSSVSSGRDDDLVCVVPFVRLDVWADGSAVSCCTDWMRGDVILGNIFDRDFNEIWNSSTAKRIRRSVTDGSFSQCTEKCPLLAEGRLPKRGGLNDQLRAMVDDPEKDLDVPPEFIKLVNDDSCNLSCPSCRDKVYIADNETSERIFEANMRVVYPLLKSAKILDILGNGEAIASRATMKLLGTLDAKTHRNLSIDLLTNAAAFDASAWNRLGNIHPLDIRLNVSVDGATKETYEKLRRGSQWERFNANMEFIAGLRREGKISTLTLNFTVQRDNYRELPLFGDLARRYAADRVILFRYVRWPHLSEKEYVVNDIFDSGHPQYEDLVSIVKQLDDPIIELGPLSVLLS